MRPAPASSDAGASFERRWLGPWGSLIDFDGNDGSVTASSDAGRLIPTRTVIPQLFSQSPKIRYLILESLGIAMLIVGEDKPWLISITPRHVTFTPAPPPTSDPSTDTA